MNDEYAPRTHVPLAAGTLVEHPEDMPELVHMHDPASFVFTDFASSRPPTVSPGTSIDEAISKMKTIGSHLLLVTDNRGAVIGHVTACDIMGEAPVRLAQTGEMSHSEITVKMIMTPQKDIQALEISHLKKAKVGHIVATLHELESCFLPVVENGRVRGIFSANDIFRHLGHDVEETMMCAHSLAEMVHTLG